MTDEHIRPSLYLELRVKGVGGAVRQSGDDRFVRDVNVLDDVAQPRRHRLVLRLGHVPLDQHSLPAARVEVFAVSVPPDITISYTVLPQSPSYLLFSHVSPFHSDAST